MISSLAWRGSLDDRLGLAGHLAETGLAAHRCERLAAAFVQAAGAWAARDRGPSRGRRAFWVPGRIEVLGKHTDYAGGDSMVVAADRGFAVVAQCRDDRLVRVLDTVTGEQTQFDWDTEQVASAGHWSNYPRTVGRRIARNFSAGGPLCGVDIAFASDLPRAAGMSSSSALMVGMFLAMAAPNGLGERPEFRQNIRSQTDLAGYLATIENGQSFGTLTGDRGVGTFGGSEDHTAILCGRPGLVSRFSYGPVRFKQAIPIPDGYTFAVGTSGVVAEKTGAAMGKYNAASRRAGLIAELWRRETGRQDPHLAAVLASGPDAAGRLMAMIDRAAAAEATPDALLARLEHFLAENEQFLPAAADALAHGDVDAFGRMVDRSQLAAEQLLGNQVPETTHLAMSARACGAAAASAFGAGFGGGVWALVETAQAEDFCLEWAAAHHDRFPHLAGATSFFVTAAGPGAFQILEEA